MSVNPNLATLMSLIEELQDQMPEGKYLEAMNALCTLHKNPSLQVPGQSRIPVGMVRLTTVEHLQYKNMQLARRTLLDTRSFAQQEYEKNRFLRLACEDADVSAFEWVSLEITAKIPIVQDALERMVKNHKLNQHYVCASVCPFIARHSFGRWESPQNIQSKWDCVCGSKNLKSKNWATHEQSDKHQAWHNAGRLITKPKQKTMSQYVNTSYSVETVLGISTEYPSSHYLPRRQTPNEWTHAFTTDGELLSENNPHFHAFTEWKTAAEDEDHTNDPLTFKFLPPVQEVLRPEVYIHNLPHLPHITTQNTNTPDGLHIDTSNWIVMMRDADYQRFIAMPE